jgi:hypothetical protein
MYLLRKYTELRVFAYKTSIFFTIKPTSCTNFSNFILEIKLYMFRTVPLSIIRSFLRAGAEWNILILLETCQQTCMTYTFAVCTVKGS